MPAGTSPFRPLALSSAPRRRRLRELRFTAAVVAHSVGDVEDSSKAAVLRMRGVEDPDLVGVGIDADVRRVLLAEHQQAHTPVAPVLVTVDTTLAARERDHLACRGIAPALGRPDRERALEHDQQLLALKVVVEVHSLAGRKLVDGEPEVLGTGGLGEPRAAVVLSLAQVGPIDVRHDPSLSPRYGRERWTEVLRVGRR